jgi:signal transduction histidine kinase/DNA-binding response OmpR family regulator
MTLSVRQKLIGAFAITLTLMFLLSMIVSAQMYRLNTRTQGIGLTNVPALELALTIDNTIQRFRVLQQLHMTTSSVTDHAPKMIALSAEQEMERLDQAMRAALTQYVTYSTKADERRALTDLQTLWPQFIAHSNQTLLPASRLGFIIKASQAFQEELAWIEQLQRSSAVLVQTQRDEVHSATISAAQTFTATLQVVVSVAALSIVCAAILSYLLSSSLVRNLDSLTRATVQVAGGDLQHDVVVDSRDELGVLATSFNHMIRDLRASREEILANQALLEQRVAERTAALTVMNRELDRAKRAAEEANVLKTRFLANMSHELRTPLNAILNFTHFLSKPRYGALTERQSELQTRVVSNAEHLLGLINDILDLSKIESGRMDLFQEETDLLPVLKGVMATAIGLTKDKGLDLVLDVPESLPHVLIDKMRIRQVLLNLLSNAAKFTEQGSITIAARITAPNTLTISVADTGIGIPPEYQAMVFEEFRQVDDELNRQQQGTGLGLPISKRLVEMHGGEMWLSSTPGQGSTFSFTLPLMSFAKLPPVEVDAAPRSDSKPLVVVIDDDRDAQRIFRNHLEGGGYAVYEVLDSRTAVAVVAQQQPRLVILDIQMPDVDGWEVLAQLRSNPTTSAIPVVICSIIDQHNLSIALGAHAHLVKPIREEELLAVLRRMAPLSTSVMLIDDDDDARAVVRAILDTTHYTVVEAASGQAALSLVRHHPPGLIILDLMLPDIDGFTILDLLRTDSSLAAVPIIVLSAKELTSAELQWLQERTQHVLAKTKFSAEDFIHYVKQLTRKETPHECST